MAINIAIVAALEREIRPLVRAWRHRDTEYGNRRFRFYESDQAVLTCAGIGAEPARRAAEAIIALYGPSLIYSAGFAGALSPELKVGDVVVPRRVVNASDGSSVDTGQGEGILISFASVASSEQKAKLAGSFQADAVDMEAAAVACAAEARSIRFAAVKAISDERNFALPPMERFISASGQFRVWHFAAFILLRPWSWGKIRRLARNSARASEALCACLRRITDVPTAQASAAATRVHEVLKG